MKKNLMHPTKMSLPQKTRIEIIALLNKSLASGSDMYAQLKQAHWNIKGMNFIALHKLLDEIAEEVEEQVDIIAERITALGGTALGTLDEAVKNTALRTYPIDIFQSKDHLEHLIHNMAIFGELSRSNIDDTEELNDMGTNDLYIDLVRMLDKNLWFLEAHLQK
jgi:starvation-inducible DNA-binding protein